MIPIECEWFEATLAVEVGCRRHLEAIRVGARDRRTMGALLTAEKWLVAINAAGGELATAKALNRFWNGSVNTFKNGGDVGQLQVRTRSDPGYDLIVRDGDRDDDVFVLVTGHLPSYRVVGWIRAREAKRPEWRHDYGGHGAAYFAPQDALYPIVAKEATQ